MSFVGRLLLAGVLCSPGASAPLVGAPSFFRSDGGVAQHAGDLPEGFDAPGALRWRIPVDSGHSSPTLSRGKIFLTTYRAAEQELATIAVDQDTGKQLWKQVAPSRQLESYHRATGSPAAATPATDGERVYVFFGSYGLLCYSLDGDKIWEQPLGPFQDEFGASSSPVLVDGKVILNEDHDRDSFLLALDARTGHTIWRTARPDAVRSYATPTVWSRNGQKELLVSGALELAAYRPDTGEKQWWMHGLARIVIPIPALAGEMIYAASWTPGGDIGKRLALDPWAIALSKWDRNGDQKLSRSEINDPEVLDRFFRIDLDQSGDLVQREWDRHADVFRKAQNAVLAFKPTGRGDVTDASLVWKYERGVPYVASPLVHNGIYWMVKDGGLVTKLDADTGKLLQDERLPGLGSYYASPVAGDGKVYFAGELGTVNVLAEERAWRVLSSHDFHEKIYATPLLDSGRIYLRTEKALSCFQKTD
ncbi:MAG: PQQ-binding-like beta-propeller repeat protein [Verrucomicrobiota bacterium]